MHQIPLRPLGEKLFVRRRQAPEKTPGGLIIPDMARERCIDGIVLRTGPGRHWDNGTTRPMSVRAGQRVWFTKFSGTEIKFEGEEVLVLYEADVIAVADE